MMPICSNKTLFGHCKRTATTYIGSIVLPGEPDGFGKAWEQKHYLCLKHANKLLKNLGWVNKRFEQKEQTND